MYTVIIEWQGRVANISPSSEFYEDLKRYFPIEGVSKEKVEHTIYDAVNNLFSNHYGNFAERLQIKHKILY